jgi:uncharacterized protein DUF3105
VRSAPRGERGSRKVLYALGGSAVVVLAVVLGFVLLRGGGSDPSTGVAVKLQAAGCTFQTLPALPNLMLNGKRIDRHEATLPKGFHYNSNPPTSGVHTPETVIYGIYDQPVRTMSTVHNLEHGGIVIRYGPDVPQNEIDEIGKLYQEDPNGLVVAPMPGLGDTIAITAWTFDQGRGNDRNYEGEGRIAKCKRFDKDALNAFIDAFRGKGPERFPVSDLKPGGP